MNNAPKGALTALITPIKNDKVDIDTYKKLIQRQIDNGISGVVPVGTTGESATLSHKEHRLCIEIAISQCKNSNTKVLAGAGSNSTKEAIELCQFAQDAGAHGVLCVSPYYNKPTQKGIYEHYSAIAKNIDLPAMLYNVPSRTGTDIQTDTAISLFKEHKNIYGIKEASGCVKKVIEIKSKCKDIVVLSGDDSLNYPILMCGGEGFISVTSNLIPKHMVELFEAFKQDKIQSAKQMSEKLYNINKNLFLETNPIPIKTAMYIANLIPALEFRLPMSKPSKITIEALKNCLKEVHLQ